MNLEDLAHFVLPSVPGCPDSTLLHNLRQAAIEFCARTLAWQQDLDTITSVGNTQSYALVLPASSALVKLLAFTVDGGEAFVVTPEKGRQLVLNDSGRDVAWTNDRVNVKVHPTPVAAGVIYGFKAALKPTQAATAIADSVGEHYAREIAAGALAGLLDMANVAWADPAKAAQSREHFNDRISTVSAQVAKGFSRGAQNVRGFFY